MYKEVHNTCHLNQSQFSMIYIEICTQWKAGKGRHIFVCLFFFETRAYYVALDDLVLVMQTRDGPQTHQNSLSLPPENCN